MYDRLLITSWGHDPGVVPTSNVLTMLNDALTHSAVLIQVSSDKLDLYFQIIMCVFFSVSVLTCRAFAVKLLCINIETVFVCNPQGHGMHGHGETVHIPFPFDEEDMKGGEILPLHEAVTYLILRHACLMLQLLKRK